MLRPRPLDVFLWFMGSMREMVWGIPTPTRSSFGEEREKQAIRFAERLAGREAALTTAFRWASPPNPTGSADAPWPEPILRQSPSPPTAVANHPGWLPSGAGSQPVNHLRADRPRLRDCAVRRSESARPGEFSIPDAGRSARAAARSDRGCPATPAGCGLPWRDDKARAAAFPAMAAAVMSGLTHTDVHHRVTRILNHAADRLRIRIQQRRVICSLHKLVRWRQ